MLLIAVLRSSFVVTSLAAPLRLAASICARFSAVAMPRLRQARLTPVRRCHSSPPTVSRIA
jgi:hypothetical protein